MKSILFCSVGRRGKLLQNFKTSITDFQLLATDNSPYAPSLYFADKQFLVPRIDEPDYLDEILQLCASQNVCAITTLIDPEIELLSKNRDLFLNRGILPLCPSEKSAGLCFDKFKLFEYLKENQIPTILTYDSLKNFEKGLSKGEIAFPVFIKPRTGSGSVGAIKVNNLADLKEALNQDIDTQYIIQELMVGDDLDADVYVDCISNKPVAAFTKRKLETKIGGASKTISFKDPVLFDFIKTIIEKFEFFGPIDMDFFFVNGKYFLSEINPRFGGAYLHAYGADVDFFKLIINNINGIENKELIGEYEDDIIMMMYDDVVIRKKGELAGETPSLFNQNTLKLSV